MKRVSITLFVLFLFAYILLLGFRPLTIPDETRYGEIPREMLTSGDWVVPRLNGLKYFEKPVFGYWANAVSMITFGENAFALRIPSALSVMISALMIFLLVRRFSREKPTAFLAPAIFLTCPIVLAIGHINLLDSLLSMLLTGSLVCFFFAHMAENWRRKAFFLALMGVFCGLAFLTKGFLAFAVPVLTVVPFLVWEGRYKDLFRIPWIPMIAALVIVLPWSLMIHFREGDFWNYFFWTEHVARFVNPVRGQHPKPLWYFLPVLMGGALPWVIQSPAALPTVLKFEMKKTRSSGLLSAGYFSLSFSSPFAAASSSRISCHVFRPWQSFLPSVLWSTLKPEKTGHFPLPPGCWPSCSVWGACFFYSQVSTLMKRSEFMMRMKQANGCWVLWGPFYGPFWQ